MRRRSPSRSARGRASVIVCAYNAADTLEDNLRSLEQLTYRTTDHSSTTDPRIAPGDRPAAKVASSTAQCRPQRGAQHRAGGGHRRDRRLHRRRHARRSRLAHLPRAAVPHLRRRRLRRAERGAGRRSPSRSIARAPGARPCARRSHRRACPAATWRSAATRCSPSTASTRSTSAPATMDVLAPQAGWKSASPVGARLASPSIVGEGLLAPAGRLRRRRDVADGAPPGKFSTAGCCGAAASPAAVRALAGGRDCRCLGYCGVLSVYRTDVHPFAFLPH